MTKTTNPNVSDYSQSMYALQLNNKLAHTFFAHTKQSYFTFWEKMWCVCATYICFIFKSTSVNLKQIYVLHSYIFLSCKAIKGSHSKLSGLWETITIHVDNSGGSSSFSISYCLVHEHNRTEKKIPSYFFLQIYAWSVGIVLLIYHVMMIFCAFLSDCVMAALICIRISFKKWLSFFEN